MKISPSDTGSFGFRTDTLSLSQGEDSPWPLHEVLAVLVEATEHLLTAHECDTHGHERFVEACRVARQLLAERSASSPDSAAI